MPWIRIDDHFDEHPKHAKAGPLAWALWLAGLAYCNRNLTDGFIPWTVAQKLVSWEYLEPPDDQGKQKRVTVSVTSGMSGGDVTSEDVINQLVWAKLWSECDDGYRVTNYSEYQFTKKQVLRQRKQTATRQQRFRDRNPSSNAVTNDVSNKPITRRSQPSQSQTQTTLTPIDSHIQEVLSKTEHLKPLGNGKYGTLWKSLETAYDQYPWLYFEDEIKKADAWIEANKKRKPTERGLGRFMRTWFDNAVEYGRKKHGKT